MILFAVLCLYAGHGGTQRFNQRMLRTLQEARSSRPTRLIVMSLVDEAERDLGEGTVFIAGRGRRLRFVASYVWAILRHRPKIMICGHVNLLPLVLLGRLLVPGLRAALCAHGVDAWGDPRYRAVRWYEGRLLRATIDLVVPVSGYTQDRIIRAFGLDGMRCHLLPNAVDFDSEIRPKREFWRERGGGPQLLSVARLHATERDKGLDQVIRAVAELRAQFRGIRYEIVGGGVLERELARVAADCGVADRVSLLGEVDDVGLESAYRRADLFVLPSRKEGFGIVFLEAWKFGLPVVCGCTDASPEVVADGGIAVDPEDVGEIVDAIASLLEDRERYVRVSDSGWQQLQRFGHESFARNVREILRLLASASAGSLR